MPLLLVLIFIALFLYELPGLLANNYRYELLIFSLFLSFSFLLCLLKLLNFDLPSPVKVIDTVVSYILRVPCRL